MIDQLPLGSWPMALKPGEHSHLLPGAYHEVVVSDDRWDRELLALRRKPVHDTVSEGRTWNVAPVLPELVQAMRPGRAIDLGCGNGRDAVWLASNGWNVTAVDRLPECEQRVLELAARHGVATQISVITTDLGAYESGDRFDLVLAHYTYAESVIELGKKLRAEQGIFSVLAHSQTHFECFGGPVNRCQLEGVPRKEFWSQDRHSSWWILR